MARVRKTPTMVRLTLRDHKGHQAQDLWYISETLSSLRFMWLQRALGFSPEAAKQALPQCHISMLEKLGSLGTTILDVEGQSLGCMNGLKNDDELIVSWHWKEACDGALQST